MTYEKERYSKSYVLRRLFSGSGKLVPLRNLGNSLRSIASAVRRKIFGKYDSLPFIPYEAIPALENKVTDTCVGTEIGSGMSTTWLAPRVKLLTSYEWNEEWFNEVDGFLKQQQISSVELVKCAEHEMMGFEFLADQSLDFAFIDGGPRSLCLRNLWPKVKRGGFLYLDNWDSDLFWTEGGIDARTFLKGHSDEIEQQTLYVDYTPLQFCVSEGLLVVKTS